MEKGQASRARAIPMETILKAFQAVPDTTIGDVRLQLISEEYFDRVLAFEKEHFFPDEPISKAIGMQWSGDLEKTVMPVLEQNMSLMAVDLDTGEVVGVRMIRVVRTGGSIDMDHITDGGFKLMMEIVNDMEAKCDVFNRYGVTEAIHFFGLAVNKAYRNKGIGGRLMTAAVHFANALGPLIGVTCIKGEGSSNFSKRIYENLKFDLTRELPYDDYRLNGEAVLQHTGEHKSYRGYVKMIQ